MLSLKFSHSVCGHWLEIDISCNFLKNQISKSSIGRIIVKMGDTPNNNTGNKKSQSTGSATDAGRTYAPNIVVNSF